MDVIVDRVAGLAVGKASVTVLTIPGVGVKTAQTIIAETGADMTRFLSAAHLASWAGVAPAVHESAGKSWSMGHRHGNKWLASMLVEAAVSSARTKTYLGAQFQADLQTPAIRVEGDWARRAPC